MRTKETKAKFLLVEFLAFVGIVAFVMVYTWGIYIIWLKIPEEMGFALGVICVIIIVTSFHLRIIRPIKKALLK